MISVTRRKIHLKYTSVLLCIAVFFVTIFSLSPVARAAPTITPKIMVSLGDSYSSGEGIIDEQENSFFYGQDKPVSEKINDPDWLAHRSEKSWPGMLKLSGVEGTMASKRNANWFFVAASGAETKDLKTKQVKKLDKTGAQLEFSRELNAQLDVFDIFKLKGDKVDYVTLTLGGNDADFAGVVIAAATSYKYLNPSGLFDKINEVWDRFYEKGGIQDKLKKAYEDIAADENAGSQAQIIVAGYPKLLNPNGSGGLFSEDNATLLNNDAHNSTKCFISLNYVRHQA